MSFSDEMEVINRIVSPKEKVSTETPSKKDFTSTDELDAFTAGDTTA